jgi:GGDEF domain-containing protein
MAFTFIWVVGPKENAKMKCPKCQHGNPEDAAFCNKCGNKIEVACPKCSKVNPADSLFCNACGHSLQRLSTPVPGDLSPDDKIEKIQRYLPKGLTEKILSQRDRIEGEHKQVTVMFCDLEGFTALSEKLGPEEAYATMDRVYEILIHKVHDFEGTVNEMTGDGIMALFGAPIALEDAPQRAIHSSLAIHREMAAFSDRLKQTQENISSLKMRIGIHTGPVVVGTLGKTDPLQRSTAEESIWKGIEILKDLKIRPYYSQGYLFLGELYSISGQREKALKYLKIAEKDFREMELDY